MIMVGEVGDLSFDYQRLKTATADRLLENFSQGMIDIVQVTKTTVDPYNPPTTTETKTRVDGVVKGVSKELVGENLLHAGLNIQSSDLEVLCNTVPLTLSPTDYVDIDGRRYTILKIINIPAVGIRVVSKIVIRA